MSYPCRPAGASDLAVEATGRMTEALETDLLGGNVLAGRWTFQVVEEFDDGHYARFRDHERRVRDALTGGVRHVNEAELKQARRTHDRNGHEPTPDEVPATGDEH